MGRIPPMKMASRFFALILCCLALTVVQSFGELVVLHHRYMNNSANDLTCISEDEHGAAMIWNYNPQSPPKIIEGFTPRGNNSGRVNCAVRTATKCLAGWNTTNDWKVKNSAEKSMGPIFDHRWEDLQEFGFEGPDNSQDYQEVRMVRKSSGNIWFSVRGEQNLQIHMCKHKIPTANGTCSRVMIAASECTKSVIKSCPTGVPEPRKEDKVCVPISGPKEHEPKTVMDLYEWRTFRIEWNSENNTINVFKNNESEPFLSELKPFKAVLEWPDELWVSVRGHATTRVRFHFYNYSFTETKNTVLTTKEFAHSGNIFHAELLVSLCQKCELKVDLLDRDNRHIETWKTSAKKHNYSDLLTWQLVKLTKPLNNGDPRDFKFTVESILDGDEGAGQWAIDNFRIFESGDKTRRSDLTLKKENGKVTCQKLSYTGANEIVDSELRRFESPEAKSQLQKFIRDQKVKDIGENGFMCNPNGCTCGRGFAGSDCGDDCPEGHYGYNCAEQCGSCQDFKKCDEKTGFCQGKCRDHKIAPFCKKALEAPTFANIGDETVTVIQKIDLNAELVKSGEVYLEEQPKKKNPETRVPMTDQKRLGNTLTLECKIKDLKHGTVYAVYTVVLATSGDQSPSDSPRGKFATTCKGKTKFEVVPAEESLTVRSWNEDCPIETYAEKDYEVIVTSTSKNDVENRTSFGSVPFTMYGLTPATNYTVKIKDKKVDYKWDLPDIRTLDSAPSKVVGLEPKSTNTTVTIRWNPPSDPGGDIQNYGVTIVLRVRRGCEDFGEETPHEEAIERNVTTTTKTFENLHPYASYVVNVWAYNSKKGIPENKSIDTESNALPASKVRNLRFNKTRNFVEWDYPDCTTVAGPAKMHSMLMKRKNATEWNKQWSRHGEAKLDYNLSEFGLDPFEEYTVRVYVVRSYDNLKTNESAYAQINFTSKPAAPSVVRNLTMYNTDPDSNTVSLRWLAPEPANGELKSYVISVKDQYSTNFSITINESEDIDCNSQEDFLCYENLRLPQVAENNDLRVEVFAQNKDVEKFGKTRALPIRREIFEQAPDEPRELKVDETQIRGIVKLEWKRPWYSPTKISSYSIMATFVSTHLLDETVSHEPIRQKLDVKYPDQGNYTEELSLLPSTVYNFSIAAVNQRRISSREVTYSVFKVRDSIGFDGKLELRQASQSSIEVKVPRILNATKNTWASITIEGMRTCDYDLSEKSSPEDRLPWGVMEYKVNNSGEQILSVSGNSYSNVSSNCSLRLGEIYTISVHVVERTTNFESSKQISSITLVNENQQESNLIWLVIIPILGIFVPVLCIWSRKLRNRRMQQRVPSYLEMLPVSTTHDSGDICASTDPLLHSERLNNRQTPEQVYAVTNNPDSCSVRLESFEEYTKNGASSGLLNSQFMKLPVGLTRACEYGSLPENIRKNRYENLIAYDHTRVVLKKINKDTYSDYINASYIQGYRKDRGYIATQGPMANTVNDFWRMIWQEDVRVICMLTNVVEDSTTLCEQYWPETMTRSKYGDILVYNEDERIFADYTFRTFKLCTKLDTRKVTHLHYTGWPSLGLPMYPSSLVAYLKRLRDIPARNGPVVVQCHNGDDRTGTIMLADICIRQAAAEGLIDAVAAITRMRDDRANMVGTPQQYLLAHILMMESLAQQPTRILCTKKLTSRIKKMKMQLSSDIQRLEDTMWQERALRSFATVNPVTAQDLAGPSPTMENSKNPIGAVSVDGVRVKRQYLASWLPTPLYLRQFWRFVVETNTKLIIILQCSDPEDPSCCDITTDEPALLDMPNMEVQSEFNPNGDDHFTTDKILLTEAPEDNARLCSVTVLTCRGWKAGENGKPPKTETLVSLWEASEKIPRREGETLVLCHDGVTGCGLYLALSFLLERMAVDRECDVFAAVRAVRRSRPQFVRTPAEFDYLYDAAVTYAECFAIYSNFT